MVGRQPQTVIYRKNGGVLLADANNQIPGMTGEYHKNLADFALSHCIAKQVGSGIDIISEGEIFRNDYWSYILTFMTGVIFEPIDYTKRLTTFKTGWSVNGIPKLKSNFLGNDWLKAQLLTSKPVKITVPGPLTLATYLDVSQSKFNLETLTNHLTKLINKEILHTVGKGCRHIQIDDPQLAIQPDAAINFGIDLMGKCFDGVPNEVQKYLHVCRGYPDGTTFENSTNKASEDCYLKIMESLNESTIDVVSIENAFHPSPDALFEIISKKTLMLGVINIKSNEIESPKDIINSVESVLKFIPKERLILAPDCGCACDPNIFYHKMNNLVTAAKQF